ncbi:unnamed protein product [Nippostrongylus brasiliensis]|uniref:DUF1330 domain-containing protein n=1 Tax=Nippostrongylus brasiliensis TaxID=27835 RepID=A0A158QXH9_NIPBR|nr:unnamed protein product [Nippostrongylus brasiliensis]
MDIVALVLGVYSLLQQSALAQPPIPPRERPDCSLSWQSHDLSYVPTLSQCLDYTEGSGVTCTLTNPFACTGRNPFCAITSDKTFKCCSDKIQDSDEIGKLTEESVKPVCPGGAIPYGIPQVMLCDPVIVNICPIGYTCVEAVNGHLLPKDARSLCCKTSTLYSFASVFGDVKLSPKIVPNPPLAAIEYVRLNVHTSASMHAPEIRTGDHFVLAPFKLYEPTYLKGVRLFTEQTRGSYLHVLLFDPLSATETMQFYYDRVSEGDRYLDLEKPIADGGFISKRIFSAPPMTNIENPKRPGLLKELREYRKRWVVLVFKTTDPLTRLYVFSTSDLHAKYRTVAEFLRSDTGRRLGTPVAGTYFFLTAV